jgi:hypothetical protein
LDNNLFPMKPVELHDSFYVGGQVMK